MINKPLDSHDLDMIFWVFFFKGICTMCMIIFHHEFGRYNSFGTFSKHLKQIQAHGKDESWLIGLTRLCWLWWANEQHAQVS